MSLLSGLKFIPRDQINEEEEDNSDVPNDKKKSKRRREKRKKKRSSRYSSGSSSSEEDAEKKGKPKVESNSTERTEAGLGWMLRPKGSEERKPMIADDSKQAEPVAEEVVKANPRELNPYLKNSGSGYPEEDDNNSGGNKLLSSSIVGDGGASWRLKALKRAQEQAAREGRRVDEIVGERWGSVSELAASETSRVAPARAHLHAIHSRRRGNNEEFEIVADKGYERNYGKHVKRDYLKDVSSRHPEMKAPKVHDSLSWGKRRSQDMTQTKNDVSAVSPGGLFASANIEMPLKKESNLHISSLSVSSKASENCREENVQELDLSACSSKVEDDTVVKPGLSSNQLAAKALQLRMKGRHKEAEELMKEAENIKVKNGAVAEPSRSHYEGSSSRYVKDSMFANRKKDEDADRFLAQNIARNKQFSVHGQADDEYDFDDGPRRKSRKKGSTDGSKTTETASFTRRILTQQERCQFCFENPKRPKHLVISIANFTYLMLPQSQPVVSGHCCILPMQHEASTRSVDNNVWEELRNFKKCLIMMFAEQEKDVVFLETVMGLAQQKRHCLIECIPLPQEIAKDAPLYFKKAIDEAEDEWSQHNAKKLIDTSVKGLRGCIPKDFPYFHVEFGLNKGFVHVIDDETQFKSSFGLNVIRGMLELAEEDMYRKRRHESVDAQRKAVTSFVQDWDRFDWTKQL